MFFKKGVFMKKIPEAFTIEALNMAIADDKNVR